MLRYFLYGVVLLLSFLFFSSSFISSFFISSSFVLCSCSSFVSFVLSVLICDNGENSVLGVVTIVGVGVLRGGGGVFVLWGRLAFAVGVGMYRIAGDTPRLSQHSLYEKTGRGLLHGHLHSGIPSVAVAVVAVVVATTIGCCCEGASGGGGWGFEVGSGATNATNGGGGGDDITKGLFLSLYLSIYP